MLVSESSHFAIFLEGMLVTSEMKCYSTLAQLKVKDLNITIVFILLIIMSPFNSS